MILRTEMLLLLMKAPHYSFSVADILASLRQARYSVNVSTVNRALTLFRTNGLVTEYRAPPNGQRKKGRPETRYKLNPIHLTQYVMIYTTELNEQLNMIKETSQELSKRDSKKSSEQFLSEIESIQSLLEEVKSLVRSSTGSELTTL